MADRAETIALLGGVFLMVIPALLFDYRAGAFLIGLLLVLSTLDLRRP